MPANCSSSTTRLVAHVSSVSHATRKSSEPRVHAPREKTCSSSCLSSLHLLRSWSLRQTRGGSKVYRYDELGRAVVHFGDQATKILAPNTPIARVRLSGATLVRFRTQ